MSSRLGRPSCGVCALPSSDVAAARAEIHAALASVRRLEAELGLAIGERLAWLKDQDRFRDSDLRTFGDYTREIFRLSGGTAWERMNVFAVAGKYEALDAAYRDGRLAARSVMDVGRVLEAVGEPAEQQVWIRRALTMTSNELRAAIAAAKPGVELDEERESVRYEISPELGELEATAKDLAEKMQGRCLSHEEFVRTAVDEMAGLPEPAATIAEARSVAAAASGHPADAKITNRKCRRGAAPQGDGADFGGRHAGYQDHGTRGETPPGERPLLRVFVNDGDLVRARAALNVVSERLACMRIRIRHAPQTVAEAEAALRYLLRKERMFRAIKASVVRIFASIAPIWFCGWGEFYGVVAHALGISRRAAEMLHRDARVHDNNPKIRAALDNGWIAWGQVGMIGALPRAAQDAWIERARHASPRGFERCVNLMLRVHGIAPEVFEAVSGRLVYRPLMLRLLRLALRTYGITAAGIRKAMHAARLEGIDPEQLRHGPMDPWEHIVLLRRLEVVLDMLGARIRQGDLPPNVLAQTSKRRKWVTRTLKASTRADLLEVLGRIALYAQVDHVPCTRARAIAMLYRLVIAQWSTRDPAHRTDPVFERDDYRCMVPGCGARGFLHDHHIDFRAHGGSNALHNRITLCVFHHGLLHEGRVAVFGRADGVLVWKLGQSSPRIYHGLMRLPASAGALQPTKRAMRHRPAIRPVHHAEGTAA